MKKNFLKSTCVVALSAVMIAGGWSVYSSSNSQMEQLLLANVEALSTEEPKEVVEVDCYLKLSTSRFAYGHVLKCPEGTFIAGTAYKSGKHYLCDSPGTYGAHLYGIASDKCYRLK